MNSLPISFERDLFQAVARFKQEHPGTLEDRTRQRKEREAHETQMVHRPHGTGAPGSDE